MEATCLPGFSANNQAGIVLNFSSCLLDILRIGSRGALEAIRRLPEYLSIVVVVQDFIVGRIIGRRSAEIGRVPVSILATEIFRRLPTIKDVMRARCVCKLWNSLLSSWEFGREWRGRECTEIESWMIMGGTREDESSIKMLVWSAASTWATASRDGRCNCPCVAGSKKRSSYREVATSHGLVCWAILLECNRRVGMIVCNPRTRKWKQLPSIPAVTQDLRWHVAYAQCACSVRFVRHDVLHHSYSIFFLAFYGWCQPGSAFLYESCTVSWRPIQRRAMLTHRLSSGIKDASVIIVDYRYCTRRGEVAMVAYDSRDDSWDEIGILGPLIPTPSISSIYIAAFAADMEGIKHHASLCANAEDEYCRLLSVDGAMGMLCLWQLDESCAAFNMVSSVRLQPSCPWQSDREHQHLVPILQPSAAASLQPTETSIIRSDDKVFVAVFQYSYWSWLIVYDVEKSSWLMAFSNKESSGFECYHHRNRCRWVLWEYDVEWHPAHDVDLYHAHVKMLIGDLLSVGATVALHCPWVLPTSCGPRLHLIHVPNIWSSP